MRHLLKLTLLLLICSLQAQAQQATIKGVVRDKYSNAPIDGANVLIPSLNQGTITNEKGEYEIKDLKPGEYNLLVSVLGYEAQIEYEVRVQAMKTVFADFGLEKKDYEVEEVVVKARPRTRTSESPVSLKSISATEIYRNPGANRDISKALRSLPGVGALPGQRNDILVRGGAPGENKFFLDGIEVPNINHFATQGSSGGPVGMINVDFIREVNFYSGAFPASRGNSLSAVIDFKQKEGNPDQINSTFTVGSSDFGLSFEGPSGENSNFIFSARRSYLQFLFKALGLPFLPTYNDFQYKHTFKIDSKNKLTIIGLAAIDQFELNKGINDKITDTLKIEENNFLINNLPINEQWNYTVGAKWQHFSENSFQTFYLSRNHLNNTAIKYRYNIEQPENLLLDYSSQEIEHKFRFENDWRLGDYRLKFGLGAEHSLYKNNTLSNSIVSNANGVSTRRKEFSSELQFMRYAAFGNISRKFLNDDLDLALGLRTDLADYSDEMLNPFNQFSPRLSASYALSKGWTLNANTGIFYQLPAYTVLGYRNRDNQLVNKENGVKYIKAIHYVAGTEYAPNANLTFNMEGFFKDYDNYPLSTQENISLANLGTDFGVIGNTPVSSTSVGRAYGMEFLAQQRLSSNFYGILSYTLVRSEFSNGTSDFQPSSWDNRHILNMTGGYKFGNNWELGIKFRYSGGTPYTPFDREASSKKENWDALQRGIRDFTKLNSERTEAFHGLDVRIDKKWIFPNLSVALYLDIENIYGMAAQSELFYIAKLDKNDRPIEDPDKPGHYLLREVQNEAGRRLPSIGLIVEF